MANWQSSERVLFGLAAIGTASWCIASIAYPMGYDQGMMASVGDVVVRGGFPYRDGFDLKGPLAFYVFALVQLLFGRVMWGIRLVDLGFLIASAAFLYFILRRLLVAEPLSRWLALSLVLANASRSWFHVSQPDGWAAAIVVIAVWTLIKHDRVPASGFVAAGVLIGASALIKPFYILFLALPVAVALRKGFRAAAVPGLLSMTGAALPIAIAVSWFGLNGALDDLVAAHVLFNLEAYSDVEPVGPREIFDNLTSYFWHGGPRTPPGPFGVLLVPVLAGMVLAWKQRHGFGLTLLTWTVISIGCVVIQGKFYVYHWLISFPALLTVAGLALNRLWVETAALRVFSGVAIGAFIAGVALDPAIDTLRFAKYMAGLDSRETYLERFERFDYRPLSAIEAATYIRTHSNTDDKVAVYGVDAIVQYLSQRAVATRFVFSLPLGVPNEEYRNRYRSEYVGDLDRQAPRYIVLGTHQDEKTVLEFPELARLLEQRYLLDTTFGRLELYRLNDSPRAGNE